MAGQGSNAELATQIADAITNRTGRIWDQQARKDLTAWFDEAEHREQAMQWLLYLSTETPASPLDPMKEFSLRRPLQDVLDGRPSVVIDSEDAPAFSFVIRRRIWWPWRRRHS